MSVRRFDIAKFSERLPDSIKLVIIIVNSISAWLLKLRMRHRIRKVLGTTVHNEAELTSLKMWMKVEDAEEKARGGKLW